MTELADTRAEGLTFEPIVVGVDPSDHAKLVAHKAAELAQLLGAQVHIVSAAYRADTGDEKQAASQQEIVGDGRADAALCEALADAAHPFRERGVEVVLHARAGDPAEAIVSVAEEQSARLILVGSRGMRGTRRYLLGDVPNKVSHHAPCGVMILKTAERHPDRGTMMLGGLALVSAATIAGSELLRLRRKGAEPVARESLDVAVAGYRSGSRGERALFLLFSSFVVTSGLARWNTWTLRRGGRFAFAHELVRGARHIHHFVPGIVIAFASGGSALIADGRQREWLAVPFGVGLALTLDEWALLLELADVYWSEEGIVSLQAILGTAALLGTLMLALRLLRRGERRLIAI